MGAAALPQHSLQNVTMIPGATALPQHSLQTVTTMPTAAVLAQHSLQNVTKTPGAEVLPQHSTGESDTFSSVISDNDSDITQIQSPQNNDQSDTTKTRNIRIPEDVMLKFLNSIGTDY